MQGHPGETTGMATLTCATDTEETPKPKNMKKLYLLILTSLAVLTAAAQVTTSGLSGKVLDENGQPLVGTTVVAVHTPSGTQYGTVADTKGNFRMMNMQPGGPYTVTYTMIGYQGVERTGIEIPLGDTYVADASLHEQSIGMDAVVVSVEGKGSAMNSERAGVGTNVSRREIEMMPTVSRSMNDILRLSPQSNTTSNGFAVGGGNYRQSYVTVDGAAFNNAFGIGGNLPAGGSPISLDALEQVTVSVTPFDVRQSGFTGGAINAVTRSGSNEFTGSVYTYLNNANLKGKYVDDYTLTRTLAQYYTYGASIGGAIVKDKLFFFVNGEYEDNIVAGPSRLARENADQEYGGDSPYNRPLASDMDALRNHLIDTYGYDPGRYAGYSVKTPGYKLMARLDWNINDKNRLSVRFARTHTKDTNDPGNSTTPLNNNAIYPGHGKDGNRLSNYALYFENSRYYQVRDFTSVAAELNSQLFDGRATNTLRFTYSYQNEPREYDGGAFPTVDILQDGDVYASFGTELFTQGNLRRVSTYVVTDEFNYRAGINNLLVGAQYEHNKATNGFMQGGTGYYVFSSLEDFYNGGKPSAFGVTHTNNPDGSQFLSEMSYDQFSFYIQDELKLHKNFHLTAGVRLEVPIYPSLKGNFNSKFAALDFGGTHYATDQVPDARVTFSPRVGFNWDLTGERKYILRGGTGYFVGRLPFVWLVSAVGNSGVGQTTYFYYSPGSGPQPGFHAGIGDILDDIAFTPTESVPASPTIIDKRLKMPASWKSSLALDIKLPGDVNFTAEGIYSKDYHPAVVSNVGYKPWDGESTITPVPGDERRYYGKMYSDETWPNKFQNVYMLHNAGNDAYYYSFSAQLHKRFRFGLDLAVAYTRSGGKSYSDGIGDQVSSAYYNNTYSVNGNNEHELGYGSYIAPDRVIASIAYRKEYGKHFATSVALIYDGGQMGYAGGWSYSRFSYTWTSNLVNDYGANSLLYIPASREALDDWNFVDDGDYTAAQQRDDFWSYINQDAYLKTRKGKYAERGGAVMPWHHQVDFKFMQDFYITTKRGNRNTLQFGIDIRNVANLLNNEWGLYKQARNTALLKYDKGNITYQRANGERVLETFRNYNDFLSTFSIQFSLRYKFN